MKIPEQLCYKCTFIEIKWTVEAKCIREDKPISVINMVNAQRIRENEGKMDKGKNNKINQQPRSLCFECLIRSVNIYEQTAENHKISSSFRIFWTLLEE